MGLTHLGQDPSLASGGVKHATQASGDLDVHLLKMEISPFRNFVYVLVARGHDEAMVVDPAWSLEHITNVLAAARVRLTGVLVTHHHFDHTNLVGPLAGRASCPVYVHPLDLPAVRGLDGVTVVPVSDGTVVTLGSTRITCLHTPGHTPGGLCFSTGAALFSGDTLFSEGCGICHIPGGSAPAMFDSLQRLKGLLAPDCHIFPGHSFGLPPGLRFAEILRKNVYLNLRTPAEFIRLRMRRPPHGFPFF
jgi:hydroxyacylglutathione hydrolase